MRAWWEQFRYIGLPRCRESFVVGDTLKHCDRLIWPWQDWVCEVEEWPIHHDCHHRHIAEMRADTLRKERQGLRNSAYHYDGYDRCDYCDRTTESGFSHPVAA